MTDDRDTGAIVSAIIPLAHCLKLTVTAEGIETKQQKALLKEEKCDKI